jgi:hypothetical protein
MSTGSKTTIILLKNPRKWLPESFETQKRNGASVNMIVGYGLPMMTGKASYRVPSVGKFNKLFNDTYEECKK